MNYETNGSGNSRIAVIWPVFYGRNVWKKAVRKSCVEKLCGKTCVKDLCEKFVRKICAEKLCEEVVRYL